MTTSTSAIYVYTDRGQHHIFQLVGGTDGTLTGTGFDTTDYPGVQENKWQEMKIENG